MTDRLFKVRNGDGASRYSRRWPLIAFLIVAVGLLAFSFTASAAPVLWDSGASKIASADSAFPSSTDGAVSATLQNDPQLGFYPNTSRIGVGETYCMDVTLNKATDLGAFEFDIAFDGALVRADDASLGSFLGSTGRDDIGLEDTRLANPPPGPIIGTATIGYGAFSCPTADCFAAPGGTPPPIAGPTGNGTIASLKVTGLAAGTSALNISNELVVNTAAISQTTAAPANGSVVVTASKPDDIVVIKQAAGTQSLYRHDAPQGLNTDARPLGMDTTVPTGNNIFMMTGGDFDGDGSDELGVLKDFGAYKAFLVYAARTACGDAARLEAFNRHHIPTGSIVALAAVDIDGNGKDEVAVIKNFGSFQALLVYNAPTVPDGSAALVAFTLNKIPRGTTGLMAGVDYNGDGTDEIAIIKYFGAARFLFIYTAPDVPNDTTIDLLAYQYTLLGNPPGWEGLPVAMFGADYNGDGVDEIGIVKQWGGAGGTQFLFIYQAPNGPWAAAPLLAWSGTPTTGNTVAYAAGIKP